MGLSKTTVLDFTHLFYTLISFNDEWLTTIG